MATPAPPVYPQQVALEPIGSIELIQSSSASLSLAQSSYTFTPSVWTRVAFALLWISSGLLAAFFMKRRGHDFRSLAALGFALGPLYLPLARAYSSRSEREVQPLHLQRGRYGSGSVDVLIGLRGVADEIGQALIVLNLLGPMLGRVTIAAAVDYETASSGDWCEVKHAAATELELAAGLARLWCSPDTVLVPGPPDQAFLRFGQQMGFDMILMTRGNSKDHSSKSLTTVLLSDDFSAAA